MVSKAKKKTKMQLDELPDGLSESSDLEEDLLFQFEEEEKYDDGTKIGRKEEEED